MSQSSIHQPHPDSSTEKVVAALEARFLRYVEIDTQSDETSAKRSDLRCTKSTSPSTAKQFELLRMLEAELLEIGATEIALHDYGALIATIPAQHAAPDAPVLAFLAHVDTAPAFTGKDVKPVVHRDYDGTPLHLPADPRQVLDPAEFPYLAQKVGHDLVTSSGDTLLGADDKAGVQKQNMQPVELAREAMRRAGLEPIEQPIRGGTDGSQLTERGVPTPNLFTGMQNVHGPREWISLQDMAQATQVCLHLAAVWADERMR